MTELKDTRWALRVTESADQVVRAAASASHRNLTAFIVGAAVGEAERVLADRTRYMLDDTAWNEFVELLDRSVHEPAGLRKLFAAESVFD